MRYPQAVTLFADTSEQKHLRIPMSVWWYDPEGARHIINIRKVPRSLWTGDFSLGGPYTQGEKSTETYKALVERKGSMTELYTNFLTRDWRRFRNVLDRMADTAEHRLLLLDIPYKGYDKPNRFVPEPLRVLDSLMRETTRRNIQVLWVPPSKDPYRTGNLMVRWLLNACLAKTGQVRLPRYY